jgi:hypothetical protein
MRTIQYLQMKCWRGWAQAFNFHITFFISGGQLFVFGGQYVVRAQQVTAGNSPLLVDKWVELLTKA